MIKNKKSQAAVEFLITYGWAIMMVLVAIGALVYFGVMNPKLPDKCIFGNGLVCQDSVIYDIGQIDIVVINSIGKTITITDVESDQWESCNWHGSNPLPSGEKGRISCDDPYITIAKGNAARSKFTIKFQKSGSALNHVSLGEVYGTPQEP